MKRFDSDVPRNEVDKEIFRGVVVIKLYKKLSTCICDTKNLWCTFCYLFFDGP